jgi:hypothetical protein
MPAVLANFKNAIYTGEMLCIDETLLAFKGRLSFKQYNPMKRARFGIKMFLLCDCDLKFVLDVLPYQGKTTQISNRTWIANYGFGGAAVLTLLQDYLNVSHRVVMDNWFLSPMLARVLLGMKTYVLGTVRRNRKGMPIIRDKLPKGAVDTFCAGDILIERFLTKLLLLTYLNIVNN